GRNKNKGAIRVQRIAPLLFRLLTDWLELEPQLELDVAFRAGSAAGDSAEVPVATHRLRVTQTRVGLIEERSVEQICEFAAELELITFVDAEILSQTEVEGLDGRSGRSLQPQISARQRRGHLVGVDIEPFVRRAASPGRLIRRVAGNDIRLAAAPHTFATRARDAVYR